MKQIELREFQSKLITDTRSALAQGINRVIVQSHVGSGKTVVATEIIRRAIEKRARVLFLAPRRQLIYQTVETLNEYGINSGVIMAGERRFSQPLVQVASFDTITARVGSGRMELPEAELCIVDECFPAGTMISTPTGDKDISIVRCGDTVYNAKGVGKVLGVSAKPAIELIKLEFEDGTTIECTGNHPIFTDRGWIKADEMEVGRVSYSIEGLRLLWECFHAFYKNGIWEGGSAELIRSLDASKNLLEILLKEIEKPNEQSSVTRKNEKFIDKNETQANSKGWKWKIASIASTCFATCTWGRVGIGVSNSNKNEKFKTWIPYLLQAGHCKREDDDWNRVRRFLASLTREESARFEENRVSCFPRLERISHIKRESVTPVFNLHISGHPSYFAGGRLVHNCHMCVSPARIKVLEHYKRVIGLTATPALANGKGMGFFYKGIVESLTMSEMVKQRYLVPMRYYIGESPDLSDVKLNADGDFVEKQLAEINDKPKLIGAIFENWKRIAGDRTTLVFAVNRKHAKHLHDEFLSHGVTAEYIDGETAPEDRERIRQNVESGITQVVVNIGVMVAGVNWPRISCIVIARQMRNIANWIQCIGRGSRLYSGKQDTIVIYHGSNFEELGMIDDPIEWSLDDKSTIRERKERAKKEAKEPKDITCAECGTVFKSRRSCPVCGHEMVKPGEAIPCHEADLVEVKPEKVTSELKEDWYRQMLGWCRRHGKKDGLAFYAYKDKFGVEPKWKKIAKEPGEDVSNWFKHRAIKRSKAA